MKRIDFDTRIERKGTASFKWDDALREFGREDVLPLWVADMDFKCADEILDACRKRLDHGILGYSIRDDRYYSAVINWFKTRHNWEISREHLVFAPPGVIFGLSLLLSILTKPGDKVIMQTPNYDSLMDIVTKGGRQLTESPMRIVNGRYELNFEDFEAKLTADPAIKVLLMANPNNPTGRLWDTDELSRIVEICSRCGVFILSDDIHSDILTGGKEYIPISSISEEASRISVVCTSTNKTFNLGGLQMGLFVISNPQLRQSYQALLMQYQTRLDNVFGTVALCAAYESCAYWVDQVCEYIAENRRALEVWTAEHLPGVVCYPMESTYFSWIDFSALGKGENLMNFLVQECGVGFTNGAEFSDACRGFMRVNLACPRSTLMEAFQRIENQL